LAYRDIFAISCDKRNKSLFDQAVAIERAIEKGGGTVRQVTGESCGSGQESSGTSEGTHFRGLYINMPRAEVQSLRISDFKIETALCKATIVSQSNDKNAVKLLLARTRVLKR
jgi:hypothetical protein